VGEMVTHIATAATEQSAATTEVNTNIEQISKITAETAEGAQQSAKACHDLSNLALDLRNVVSQFKLSNDGRGSAGKSYGRAAGRSTAGSPAKSAMRSFTPAPETQQEEEAVTAS